MKHLTRAVQLAVENKNWYAALITALTLPDIAGWVDSPCDFSSKRYAAWFKRFVQPKYTHQIGPKKVEHVFLSGNDCYALRCAILHEGRDVITDQKAKDALDRFQFLAPPKSLLVHMNQSDTRLQLQVDCFCQDVVDGVLEWLTQLPKSDGNLQARLEEITHIQTEVDDITI